MIAVCSFFPSFLAGATAWGGVDAVCVAWGAVAREREGKGGKYRACAQSAGGLHGLFPLLMAHIGHRQGQTRGVIRAWEIAKIHI